MPRRRRFVWGATTTILILFVYACRGTDHPAASNGSGGDVHPSGVAIGPCTPEEEGKSIPCHVETGRHGDTVDCFSGTQTCENGVWGACGGSGTLSRTSLRFASRGGGLNTLAITSSDAGSGGALCASNPCDPNCLGIDADAGQLTPGAFSSATIVATATSFDLLPSPKTESNAAACTANYASTSQCSYDMCCQSGTCKSWPSATNCLPCNGPDYTMAVGCQDQNGDTRIAICNRGSTDAPTTGTLQLRSYPGNPPSAGNASVCQAGAAGDGTCTLDLAIKTLKAGTCVDLNFTKAADANPANRPAGEVCVGNFSGNRYLMINPTFAQPECDTCNNFSFNYTQQAGCIAYGAQPPPPASNVTTYVASCLPGYHVRWNQFAYDTSVPSDSSVTFSARTAPRLLDGGTGTFTSSVVIANPATPTGDPAICPLTGGVAGCPVDLYAKLGGAPAATNEVLELSLALTPITSSPTVYGWHISYDCVPAE